MKLIIMAPYMFALGPGVNRSFGMGAILELDPRISRKRAQGAAPARDARVEPEHDEHRPENAFYLNRFAAFLRKSIQPAFFSASAWM
ncbi:hypothetical protein [uncultured Bosea sp.]|uniref:hypothetical protein n=1 Tax=uncultured Bosea sp. TaxID=211457 RepID=UPI0025DC55A6|nr:hypothetical protein [uncultured Bosea sp.]